MFQCIQHVADGFAQATIAWLGFDEGCAVIKPLATNRENLGDLFPQTLMKARLNAKQQSAVGHLAYLGSKARTQITIKAPMKPTVPPGRVQSSLEVGCRKGMGALSVGRQVAVRPNRSYRLASVRNETRRIYRESRLMRGSAHHTNGEAGTGLAITIMIDADLTCPTIPLLARPGRGRFRQEPSAIVRKVG